MTVSLFEFCVTSVSNYEYLLFTEVTQSGVLDIKNQSLVIPATTGIHDSDLISTNGFSIKALGSDVILVLRNFSE